MDRLLAALFPPEPEPSETAPNLVRTVHDARRLRQSGDLDGALAAFNGVDTTNASDSQLRWLYGEWLDIARRRFAGDNAALYSPATGKAAVLVPTGDGRVDSRRRPGDALAYRQDGLPPQPAGPETAGEGRRVMVVANATVDIAELKARNPLGDAVEAAGIALRGKGRVRQGVCPFHKEGEGSFTVYADSEKFYCFGCGAGGDVLDFVQRMEGLTLPEAIRRLGDGSASVATAPSNRAAPAQRPTASPAAFPPRDPALLTAAARSTPGNCGAVAVAREYLASRGIGLDAAQRLGLGYATGHGLRDYLESAGFDKRRLRDSGLFLERGAERFAGMITVPDVASGRVRWLTGQGGAG